MKAVIIGAGNVGSTLAEQLVEEGFDVVVIEKNPKVVEELSSDLDILAIEGTGASPKVLKEAGLKKQIYL